MFWQIVFLSLLLFSRLKFSLYLSEGLSTTSITKKESGERKRERRGPWGVLQPLTSPPRPQENALQSGARLPPTHSLNHDPSIFPTILPFSKENHLQSIKKIRLFAYQNLSIYLFYSPLCIPHLRLDQSHLLWTLVCRL